MDVVIPDLKLVSFDIRQRKLVQPRVFHVNDASATQADEVVVLGEIRIETRRRARVTGPSHQSQGNERAQDTMHRHARDLWQLTAHFTIELLCRGMIAPVQDCLENGATLGRDRQTALPMRGEEAVHPFTFSSRAHEFEDTYVHQMIIICKWVF